MVALVVVLAAALCAAVALGSPEIKHNFYSPLPGSPEIQQKYYSPLLNSPEIEQDYYFPFLDSHELEQDFYSPLLDSPELEQDYYSPLLDSGRPSQENRIVDGEEACPDQFRHHAYIVSDDQWSYGGSLIKPTAVLTRGQLVAKNKKFTIYLGTIFREGDDSAFVVESIWGLVHPEYDKGGHYNNDVAVILLNVEAPLGKSIWPVKLPSFHEFNETFTGQRALISGFGKVDATGQILQDRLRFAEVTVISNDLCKSFFKKDYVSDSKLCAGNVKTAFCQGDHGGALVIKTGGQYKQIGIASFMDSTCGNEVPGVYTRVTSFLEWIQRAAGNLDDWGDDEYSYYN